jgi:hypothetical protein
MKLLHPTSAVEDGAGSLWLSSGRKRVDRQGLRSRTGPYCPGAARDLPRDPDRGRSTKPAQKSVSALFNFSLSRVWHSHNTSTRYPASRNRASLRRSRFLFPSSFSVQYGAFDFGFDASAHLPCECQKHPCTKIAHRRALLARSGLPGNVVTCVRKRRPRAWTAARVRSSGRVFFDRMRAIICDRVSGLRRWRGASLGTEDGILLV